MNSTFREDKTIEIEIKEQLKYSIDMFGDEILESAPSPVSKHLLVLNEGDPPLYEYHRNRFHYTASKLLYITKITRPDIEPTVDFLFTQVEKVM